MPFSDFLRPLKRQKSNFILTFILLFALILGGILMIPPVEKTTIYISLKPIARDDQDNTMMFSNAIEEGSKVAETVAGWARNPAYRQEILDLSGQEINRFKNKFSAQKQNRLNVFWTLKLAGKEIPHTEKLTQAVIDIFEKEFADFNNNSSFPFGYSNPSIFTQKQDFPLVVKVLASLFGSLFFTILGFFLLGSFQERLLFGQTVKDIFPKARILKITDPLGRHDEKLIKNFLQTFENPQIIGLFPGAEKVFPLPASRSREDKTQSPVLVLRLWDSSIIDIENTRALTGPRVGIIIFER